MSANGSKFDKGFRISVSGRRAEFWMGEFWGFGNLFGPIIFKTMHGGLTLTNLSWKPWLRN
ncbi:unnamed protein product [Rhodiola kirilowii]